ncbi:unnamed protein product, partial [marine sediment metagenome]
RQRGMGLAAVAGIVKQHYGHLDLKSAPEAGTQFSISFPIELYVERAELVAEGEEALQHPPTATILLVDDNRTFRQAARQMIEMMGHECLEAVNGLEGVRAYARDEERIDIVLLDMMMPVMSGRETYECLRAINPEVKVIFSSGLDIQYIVYRMEIGPEARYIQKPYTLHSLHKKIDETLGRIPANGRHSSEA